MKVLPYTDGLGNIIGIFSEHNQFAGAVVIPDWCEDTLQEAVNRLLTGDVPSWYSLLNANQTMALEGLITPDGEPFDA